MKAKIEQASHLLHSEEGTQETPKEREGLRAGAELVGGLLGGVLFGWCIDALLGSAPFAFLIGMGLGIFVGFYNIWRMTRIR